MYVIAITRALVTAILESKAAHPKRLTPEEVGQLRIYYKECIEALAKQQKLNRKN